MADLSMFSLEGRRALVTGGGRGLGAGIAAGLARAGAQVAIVSRSEPELRATADGIGAVAVVGDVSETSGLALMVDSVESALGGPVDVVVHAAGIQHRESAETFAHDDWERVIHTNLASPFFLSQEVGRRQLAEGRTGSHIFIGSLSSHFSLPSTVAYTASKAGVWGVLRNLSLEWSGRGIRVNGIGPGYIRTALTEAVFTDPVRSAQVLGRIPMNRFGEPDDMAGAAVFLASDASSYVTGQLLMVDGGWTAS